MTHLNPLSSYSLFLRPHHVSKLDVFLTAENAILMVLNSWSFVFSCIPRVCAMSCADWEFRKYLLNQSVVTFSSSSCTQYPLRLCCVQCHLSLFLVLHMQATTSTKLLRTNTNYMQHTEQIPIASAHKSMFWVNKTLFLFLWLANVQREWMLLLK